MPPSEQVPSERYRPGQRVKVYIVEVRRSVRGPEIIASRTHTELIRRLFETEVPEIFNGVVEIKAIAREPGMRSKVAVFSNQDGVDPVGACVGLRGIRIQNVVNELMGEKIDVIEWGADPSSFIANSLSPAQVEEVRLDHAENSATVIVPDRQLSLAIGREGQNARLAAKLTNWRIDIKSLSEAGVVRAPAPHAAPKPVQPAVAPAPVSIEVAPSQQPRVVAPAALAPAPAAAAAEVKEHVQKPAAQAPAAQPATQRPAAEQPVPTVSEPTTATSGKPALTPEEELALLSLEEELKALEAQERAEQEAGVEKGEAQEAASVASEDIWQVPDVQLAEAAGQIRFAEDILDYRELSGGKRGGGRARGGGDRMSAKARRAAARRAGGGGSTGGGAGGASAKGGRTQ